MTEMPHVLLLEDEPSIQDVFRRILELQGYRVSVASRLVEAEDILRGHNVDLIIADLLLPEGSGLEITQTAADADPPIPVVVVTGDLSPLLAPRGQESIVAEVVHKPIGCDELVALVRRHTTA